MAPSRSVVVLVDRECILLYPVPRHDGKEESGLPSMLDSVRVANARVIVNDDGEVRIEGLVAPHVCLTIPALGTPVLHDLQHAGRVACDSVRVQKALIGMVQHHDPQRSCRFAGWGETWA